MIDKIKGFIKRHKKLFVFACVTVYIALSLVVNTYAANDSSLLEISDGKSYDGLPAFPTSSVIKTSQGTYYEKYFDYILYQNTSSGIYYLLCSTMENGQIYINNGDYSGNGVYKWYNSDLKSYDETFNGSSFTIYSCGSSATTWTKYSSSSCPSVKYADTLLQSSCNIYSDSSCNSVFTQSAAVPLILGISSSTITKTMMNQIVGLVPLVIGLVICCLAFWKGFRMLRQALLMA